MNRVFIDMDGVLADFEAGAKAYRETNGLPPSAILKNLPGVYRDLPEIDGAISSVRSIMKIGFDVWVATKPPTGIAHAYADKAQWIFDHLPELTRKVIVTPDKGLLGDDDDFLIDDRPHKANCELFPGILLRFGYPVPGTVDTMLDWNRIVDFFVQVRCALEC